jgi:hypothetical protein
MAAMPFIPPGAANSAPTWAVRLTIVFLAAIFTVGAIALLSNRSWVGGGVLVGLTALALLIAVRPRVAPHQRRRRS